MFAIAVLASLYPAFGARYASLMQRGATILKHNFSAMVASSTASCSVQDCADPPTLDGEDLKELICKSDGMLIVANPDMACTKALTGVLGTKGAPYTLKDFGDGDLEANPVWSWLHNCLKDTAPGDKENGATMHSYAFLNTEFLGQGFDAARTIAKGDKGDDLPTTPCSEQFPNEKQRAESVMSSTSYDVLLFGSTECPCTGIAHSKFASLSLCFEEVTWDGASDLMGYLQCSTGDYESHSFIYYKVDGTWTLKGNGFRYTDMKDDEVLAELPDSAERTCEQPTVAKNLYGKELGECRKVADDTHGSWMSDGKCTEATGGVHQICIDQLPADFSTETHQPAWSEERENQRHCVCIGAWSLYMTDAASHSTGAEKIMPLCKAIPETVLTKRYLNNWKKWNEYPAQVLVGVKELVDRCFETAAKETDAKQLQCGLKERFESMQADIPELNKTTEIDALRTTLGGLKCD